MDFALVHEIDCKQGAVRAVRFSVDGSYCLTCGSDRKLKLWNPHRNVLLKTYGGHADQVMDADAACDSSQVVSCGADKSVIVWDVASGTPVRRLRGHAGPVTCVRFNEESTMVVSGSRDNSAMCWDTRSRSQDPAQVLDQARDAISSVRISDHEILTASFDTKVRRYDIRVGELYTDCTAEPVTCASFTRDGQCTLISCADGVIRLIDKDSGELLGEFSGHVANDLCLESIVDTQDKRIFSGSGDGNLFVWDLTTQKLLHKLLCQRNSPALSVSVHPLKNCLLVSSGSKIFMWEEKSNEDQ